MIRPSGARLASIAVAALLLVSAHNAGAQTVWVRNLMPGGNADLIVNSDTVAHGVADAGGLVKLVAPTTKPASASASMHMYVDACGNLYHVILMEAGLEPQPTEGGCQRTALPQLFDVRSITTFVVDASGASALVRQGPAYDEWLHPVVDETGAVKSRREPLPRGLVISGGGAAARFSNVVTNACGDASSCSGQNVKLAPAVGATFWVTRFLAVEAAYLQPFDANTSGTGTNLTFSSVFQTRLARADVELGVRAGPMRLYAMGGVDYAVTSTTTTQTVTASAIGKGGAETFALKTTGFGPVFGGGIEGWLNQRLALFVEGGRAALKGSATGKGQGSVDDALLFGTIGVRLRLGL